MSVVSRYTCTGLSTGVVSVVVCCRCSLTRVWLTLNATRRTRRIHQKPVCVVYRPWTTPSGPTVNSHLCHFQTTIIIITSPPVRLRSIAMSVSACLSVCMLTYLKITRPNFTKFSVHVIWDRGSVLLWWQLNTLHTSGFVEDVIFTLDSLFLLCVYTCIALVITVCSPVLVSPISVVIYKRVIWFR